MSSHNWKPYSVSFESPEGHFSFCIYAISFEHAELQLDAIREAGKVDGELIDYKSGD